MLLVLLILTLLAIVPMPAVAAWTPMIQVSDFDGIKTDVTAVATGIIMILLIIIGIGLLVKVLGR
ncbi:hypothetical protein FO488_08745 [Geobacter sp. FeAm09]|uniref:hypothetical protein n=1 Tax=Geobacter sp. FeAm09 TaxID=2597769 RepID=UPI0011F007DB|nr:hypothetical protein [Geobacter sp. FeAm09]QEM68242.1 hypothetical protein FO488_08745 [Geobacter sp. FeAm09]